jgi:hypothetical protein
MTIVADSHMGMILPEDISSRIAEFMAGRQNFPFIKTDELICIFYLFGKNNKVNSDEELKEVIDLADRTVANMTRDIEIYSNNLKAKKVDSEFIRSKYINRELQITVEKNADYVKEERIRNDPTLLSDCFAQHVSYYNQEYFFQIYGPLKESEMIKHLQKDLVGRMVMIGYNRKGEKSLPFQHALIPLYIWTRDHQIAAKS